MIIYNSTWPNAIQWIRVILSGFNLQQETPQCDETRFSTIQPSIDVTGIRNER